VFIRSLEITLVASKHIEDAENPSACLPLKTLRRELRSYRSVLGHAAIERSLDRNKYARFRCSFEIFARQTKKQFDKRKWRKANYCFWNSQIPIQGAWYDRGVTYLQYAPEVQVGESHHLTTNPPQVTATTKRTALKKVYRRKISVGRDTIIQRQWEIDFARTSFMIAHEFKPGILQRQGFSTQHSVLL